MTTDGAYDALRKDAQRLSDALARHPETPDAVGEPAVDLVIGVQAMKGR